MPLPAVPGLQLRPSPARHSVGKARLTQAGLDWARSGPRLGQRGREGARPSPGAGAGTGGAGADPNLRWQEVWPPFPAWLGSAGRPTALGALFPALARPPIPAAGEARVPRTGLPGAGSCAWPCRGAGGVGGLVQEAPHLGAVQRHHAEISPFAVVSWGAARAAGCWRRRKRGRLWRGTCRPPTSAWVVEGLGQPPGPQPTPVRCPTETPVQGTTTTKPRAVEVSLHSGFVAELMLRPQRFL